MINVDTVYQKVLALANKEQRGYITPQEFNLFADKAQKEILEQYFYDINQFSRINGNDTEYSDMLNLLDEKLAEFKGSISQAVTNGNFPLNSRVYKIGSITSGVSDIEIEQVNHNEHRLRNLSPLTRPTDKRPVYVHQDGVINIFPNNITSVVMSFIKKPSKPKWGYVIVNEKALFDPHPQKTQNFVLHQSEESELVYRILTLAGIAIEKPGQTQVAASLEAAKVQQEKK